MLNTMIKNENKTFTNTAIFSEIIIPDQGICKHDLRKEITKLHIKIVNALTCIIILGKR